MNYFDYMLGDFRTDLIERGILTVCWDIYNAETTRDPVVPFATFTVKDDDIDEPYVDVDFMWFLGDACNGAEGQFIWNLVENTVLKVAEMSVTKNPYYLIALPEKSFTQYTPNLSF